ncbi:MAG: FHA domain-containing serine/threonine-protein kinase [Polyangiales bacterium]
MEALPAGTLIAGRYQVIRTLGRGSVKQVYLAQDRLGGGLVAVALLREHVGSDRTVGARFSREARAASVLTSPYTVRVFDAARLEDGTRYLVTEAVLGRGLDEALGEGPVSVTAAAMWAAQILTALSEAHARGMVHRDVKPENVLLAPATDDAVGEVARLTDFGLAKILDDRLEGSVALRTAQGVVMGTPDYMPPEQWQGRALDARADLYAAGVTLYEMLTGETPFEGDTLEALGAQHLVAEPRPFDEDTPAAMRALEPVVMRALAKDPRDRWPSAEAMRAEVLRAAGVKMPPPPTVRAPLDEGLGLEVVPHAEIVCDEALGAVQVLAAPRVVIGRSGHVVARCFPESPENERRGRSVSRRHARVEWRAGGAWITDLRSASGTTLNGRRVPSEGEPVALAPRDELGLGPHVRFVWEQGPTTRGALPPWAKLTRVDRWGEGLSHVFVLREAVFSADPGAAFALPRERAGEGALRFTLRDGRLMARAKANDPPTPLADGQAWCVGALTFRVAMQ